MARRYIGVSYIDNERAAVEVRARTMKEAKREVVWVLKAAYPKCKLDELEVCRLKIKGGVWKPVSRRIAELLPKVNTWLAPADVEISNIVCDPEQVETGTEVVPLPQKVTKPASVPKPEPIKLGIDDAFIRRMGNTIKEYDTMNEVKR